MQAVEFDTWRDQYDTLTFDEHAAFYRRLHADHPDQRHFCAPDALRFFDSIDAEDVFVCELGGYDGALAQVCLDGYGKIRYWDNFDLAPPENGTSDPRYRVDALFCQLWDTGIPFEWDVFVASHVIEHLSQRDLEALFDYIKPSKWVYLDAPLSETQRPDWSGGTCAHKLNLCWFDIDAMLAERGFERWAITETARCYRRRA